MAKLIGLISTYSKGIFLKLFTDSLALTSAGRLFQYTVAKNPLGKGVSIICGEPMRL